MEVIKLMILRWRDYLESSRWALNAITCIFIRWKQREIGYIQKSSRHVITEAGSGVVWPQVREYHQKLEEGKEWIVP